MGRPGVLLIVVAELARRTRSNARYSQRAFARQLGMSPGELSEILRGKRPLSLKAMLKVARSLGLTGEEEVEPVPATVIPRAAVAQDQGGSFVFVVGADNVAQRRPVRLGRGSADLAVVENGLQPGENVITEGLQRVRPGQPVNPAPAGAPPGRPGGPPGAPAR